MRNYDEDSREYRFEGDADIQQAKAFIAKANNRLAKAGISDRFEAVNEETGTFESKQGEFPFQITKIVDFWEFDLNAPSIGYDGWTFVASVSFEEGGTLVNAVPGQSLVDWVRPEEHLCEHCGTKRSRTKSYVLRNEETGEYKQVGSSCLVLFLGVAPALWAVGLELPEGAGDHSGYTPRYDRNTWLAIALAVSERGLKFVSKGHAQYSDEAPTAYQTAEVYTPNTRLMSANPEHRAWVESNRAEAERILAEEPELIEDVIAAGNAVGVESDYGMNLAVALASETVSSRALGILTSVVAIWNKDQVRQVEEKAHPVAEGFLGEVKERLRGLKVTITFVKYFDGNYGTTTLVKFRTEDGHVAAWFASGYKDFEIGQELVIDGTVKKLERYNDQDQTSLSRVAVKG